MNEETLRKEFNEKFPPPMLLGQNQEQVANFWLSKLSAYKLSVENEVNNTQIKLCQEFANTPLDERKSGWDWMGRHYK